MEDKDYSHNSVGKVIAKMKTFFEYLLINKRLELPNYFKPEWIVQRQDVDHVYLSNEELMSLFHLDLSGLSERHERARDLFLIGAFTGLRVSDYNLLTDKHIIEHNEMSYFKIYSKKTGQETYIPIASIVFKIMERNNGLPKPMLDQEINLLIKEVGESAGFDRYRQIRKTIGGRTVNITKPLFEWIMTHTGRRSFCTNAYLGGLDSLSIMAVSGHKTESNFLKYIKVTRTEQAERIAEHPYFKGLTI